MPTRENIIKECAVKITLTTHLLFSKTWFPGEDNSNRIAKASIMPSKPENKPNQM